GSPTSARCYKIALGALGACCIIRTLVIALGAWGKLFRSCRSINDLHLFPLPPAGGSRCKLCPRDWVLHGDKCYWLSNEADSWSMSHDDCSRKGSQMLVIQDRKQMVTYILCQGTERAVHHVSVLFVTLSDHLPLFNLNTPCGVWKENQIRGEFCSGTFKWICQREAVLI
uniref:C-type lectin domain-containing protein n=1 Tax=Chrysemys picta bellii TaxID=8478 RepID=A0A8C3HWV1_CHRPI